MRRRDLYLAVEYLTQQMNHWILFPLFLAVAGCTAFYTGITRPPVLLFLSWGLFPAAFFLIRSKAKGFWLFLFLHLAVMGVACVFPAGNTVERALCVLFAAGYLIDSFLRHFQDKRRDFSAAPPAAALTLALMSVLIQYNYGRKDWELLYVLALAGVLAVYFLISYIQHYLVFLSLNEENAGCLPARDMFHSGFGLVTEYTAAGVLIMLLGANTEWLTFLWGFLKRGLIAVLRFLLSLLPQKTPEETVVEEVLTGESMSDMMLPASEQSASLFWRILEWIVVFALVCGLVFLLFKGILALVRFIRAHFGAGFKKMQNNIEDGAVDVREKCGLEGAKGKEDPEGLFRLLSPAQRVRRLYRRKAKATSFVLIGGPPGKALSLLTARECAELLHAPEIADIYERARYSDTRITQEHLRKMRKACREKESSNER